MSRDERDSETEADGVGLPRTRTLFRYPGRDPVTVMTTRLPGVEPTREERIRVGLRRLALEGRAALGD
ncbi:MAG TPA: hypothetical protein VLB79_13455 [Solirubrobacterales bacterium]|nr:hypothetical protein [Solirubrobacterales bacterium]